MKEMISDLIKAQKELKPISKRGKNPHFNSEYAEYEDVVAETKRVLNANNMFVTHVLEFISDRLFLSTKIFHISGETLSSQMPIINKAGTDQGLGSSITYTKRYSLEALLGASSQKDDDGNAATGNEVPAAKKAGPKADTKSELSDAQIKRLFAIAHAHKWTNERVKEYMKFKYATESTKDLSWQNYELLIKAIEASP
jgi:hypothetical protein